MIITLYNIFQKVTFQETDISNQYKRAYNADKYYLENNNQTIKKDDYEKVVERINLEKYAIDNNIKYNILLNSQNKNAIIPQDARILLMFMIITLIICLFCNTILVEWSKVDSLASITRFFITNNWDFSIYIIYFILLLKMSIGKLKKLEI